MTYSPAYPMLQRAKEMLDAARDSPVAQRLSASGFDIDMSDTEQANALALHVLHQVQILDATTRILAGALQSLQRKMECSESLFVDDVDCGELSQSPTLREATPGSRAADGSCPPLHRG